MSEDKFENERDDLEGAEFAKGRPATPYDLILPEWFDDHASLAISLANKDCIILILAHPDHQPAVFNFETRRWDDSCLVTLNDEVEKAHPETKAGVDLKACEEELFDYIAEQRKYHASISRTKLESILQRHLAKGQSREEILDEVIRALEESEKGKISGANGPSNEMGIRQGISIAGDIVRCLQSNPSRKEGER